MSLSHSPSIVHDSSLVLCLDAANTDSYPGTGSTWKDLTSQANNSLLVNSPSFSSSNKGNIYFNRTSNNSAYTGNINLSTTTAVTVSMWLYLNSLPTVFGYSGDYTRVLCELTSNFNGGNAFYIATEYELTGFRFQCGVRGDVGYNIKNISNILPVTNTWYNITFVMDNTQSASNQVMPYLNGINSNIIVGTTSNNGQTYNSQNTNTFSNAPLYIASRGSSSLYSDVQIALLTMYSRALSPSEIFQNYNALRSRFQAPVTSTIYLNGLYGKRYSGYFNDNVNYFATATRSSGTNSVHGDEEATINFGYFTSSDITNYDGYSWQWVGYFKAPYTDNYTFTTTSDDASYLWLGSNAISGFTTSNATVNNGGLHGSKSVTSSSVSLVGGQYYPIRIQFGENGGGDFITVSYSSSTETDVTNFSGKFFYITKQDFSS